MHAKDFYEVIDKIPLLYYINRYLIPLISAKKQKTNNVIANGSFFNEAKFFFIYSSTERMAMFKTLLRENNKILLS